MTYQECVEYILTIPMFAGKLGTKDLNRILDIMGHPERSYPVIHVAGTNGKGSVCAMLESILREAGYKTGLYTSPHIWDYTERIKINGINNHFFFDLIIPTNDTVKQVAT